MNTLFFNLEQQYLVAIRIIIRLPYPTCKQTNTFTEVRHKVHRDIHYTRIDTRNLGVLRLQEIGALRLQKIREKNLSISA